METESFFAALLMGHIIGDYLLQPKKWAQVKYRPGVTNGWYCALHCVVYATAVTLTTFPWVELDLVGPWWAFIFVTHYLVDRHSLADHWLRLIKGRHFRGYSNGHSSGRTMALEGGFYAVVYTVVDNGIHLLVSYYGVKLFAGPSIFEL